MILVRCAFLAAVALVIAGPCAAAPHAEEIKAYAFVLAAAQVASDRCADILISRPMLEDMRTHFHIGEADGPSVQREGSAAAQKLADRIAAAPSLQAWCDAAYGAYGPEGSVLPKLMLREAVRR